MLRKWLSKIKRISGVWSPIRFCFRVHIWSSYEKQIDMTPLQPHILPWSIAKDELRREIRLPQKYVEDDLITHTPNAIKCIDSSEECFNFQRQLIVVILASGWLLYKEIESSYKNGIWELVKLSKGRKVPWKWVFKRKEGTPGVETDMHKVTTSCQRL